MLCKHCSVTRVTLWTVWTLVSVLARAASFNHWLVTEEGKIEFQIGSPFNLRQPYNLLALLQQEERVTSLEILREELLNFRDQFDGFGDFDSFEESFFALDPECRNVQSITTFDLYISTVLPLEHKQISLSDHLDPAYSKVLGEPYCLCPLDFSVCALEHLEGVQERYSLVAPAERSVLASVNMKIETLGNLVHYALEKNSTSWVLLDLATLYWRARGNVYNAMECVRRALHYSPPYASDIAYLNMANVLQWEFYASDIAYLNMANVLHRSQHSKDAIIPLKLAIDLSPTVNVLHYTLGNVYVSLGRLNDSIPQYRYSLSLEPTSEPVLSVYSSVMCEIRKLEASMEYSRKLDATQAKLDEFYDKVELVKRSHIVEKGHRGQWDIDTSRRGDNTCSSKRDSQEEEDAGKCSETPTSASEETSKPQPAQREEGGERGEQEGEREMEEVATGGEGERNRGSKNVDVTFEQENNAQEYVEANSDKNEKDSSSLESGNEGAESSPNGTATSKTAQGKSRLRLVLRPLLDDDECSNCEHNSTTPQQSSPVQSHDRASVQSCSGWGCFRIDQPVCKLNTPFHNYSRAPSGYCADTRDDCALIEGRGRPGLQYCEVKGENTRVRYDGEGSGFLTTVTESLNCALADRGRNDCLRTLQEQLKNVERRREEKAAVVTASKKPENSAPTDPPPKKISDNTAKGKTIGATKTKDSSSGYSTFYQALEFLPYNPLPTEIEDIIFPEKGRPLAIFDDPYWPNKANCIKLVDSLKGTASALSSFTGTYLSPEAKDVETDPYFKNVPYPIPPYLRQQPRCTDIVELPYSMAGMDHLYPVMYRSQLKGSKMQTENGLKKVLTNAVSNAMGRSLSFEESGEAVYAAMVKNGPNWALFTVASLYWRVSGKPQHSIECLRRSLHYCPNSAKDVGYIGLANVFHRHGFMNEAVVAARAGLDVVGDSPVGHYTLAGIYLTLRDYVAASLHLRTALHLQPTFEHALSALRLVRCSLKFKEEQEFLKWKIKQPEESLLKQQEAILTRDINRALESIQSHEKIRQPPPVVKPPEVLARENSSDQDNPFVGEDAVRYMTNLALLRDKRNREAEKEGEKERREREEIERKLREEILKVENDGSLEEFIRRKRSQEGNADSRNHARIESNELDITPLVKQIASQIQAENNNYDPQLIAQSRAEIEAELKEIIAASARAIANDQSPVQRTIPTRIISHEAHLQGAHTTKEDDSTEEVDLEEGDGKRIKDTVAKDTEKERVSKEGSSSGAKETKKDDTVQRYPGYRPWPSLQECAAMSLPKTLLFTSTWLSVTAKGIKVIEHVDYESPLEDTSLLPHCHNDFPDSEKTFSNLAGMNGVPAVEHYKSERGLMEVLCNLSGAYRSVEDVASRISLAMQTNTSSWVLSNLAALYWRVVGDGALAINCLRHSLFYSDSTNKDVALVSLANVLYRMGHESDATAVMQHSLEVNHKLVVNHFTMANLLAARGFAAEAAGYFESTLQFQPGFEPAAERLKAVRCISLLKHIQETREKEEKRQKEYEEELERQLQERRKAMMAQQ